MFKKFSFNKKLSPKEELVEFKSNANKILKNTSSGEFKSFDIYNYSYSVENASKELGLNSLLIEDLVEDFVSQIIKIKPIFLLYIDSLKKSKKNNQNLDYTLLRDLAHKNLGVARNLRIEDAQNILNELMKKDDLEYLKLCVKILEASVIRLKPEVAFKVSKEIEIKISV